MQEYNKGLEITSGKQRLFNAIWTKNWGVCCFQIELYG